MVGLDGGVDAEVVSALEQLHAAGERMGDFPFLDSELDRVWNSQSAVTSVAPPCQVTGTGVSRTALLPVFLDSFLLFLLRTSVWVVAGEFFLSSSLLLPSLLLLHSLPLSLRPSCCSTHSLPLFLLTFFLPLRFLFHWFSMLKIALCAF